MLHDERKALAVEAIVERFETLRDGLRVHGTKEVVLPQQADDRGHSRLRHAEGASPGIARQADRIEAAGLARTHLVAPFFRTVIGTDTYTDQLW